MNIIVKAISRGRWSISPKNVGAVLVPASEIPGYKLPWPRGISGFLEKFLQEKGYPLPSRVDLYLMSEHQGCPCDHIQVEFPWQFRFDETTKGRRAGLEKFAQFLDAA